MNTQETIEFEISFTSIYSDQPAYATILVDDQVKFADIISDVNTKVLFKHTLAFDKGHTLTIKRSNKTGENQMLVIDRIKIDGIDIRNIIYTDSINEPQYPKLWELQQLKAGIKLEKQITGETYLGHNSTWHLNFTSPFYQFLMNKMD
jgi:hypothetical protein